MKKLLLLLFLWPLHCYPQKREYSGTNIKFAPFALGVFPAPAIQFSAERTLNKRFSVQGELGYGIFPQYYYREWVGYDSAFIRPFGIRSNMEIRYHSLNSHAGRYIAINAFYRYQLNNGRVRYQPAYDSSVTLIDGLVARKHIWGMALVFGYQKIYHWFVINPYFGFGFNVRYIKNRYREYTPANGDARPEFIEWHALQSVEDGNLSEHSGIQAHLTLGLRLGYAFRKHKN